jgi:hypothetical protein
MQEINDQVPEWIRMQPGETVRAEESRGITIPGAGVHYLHGLTVIDEVADHLPEPDLAELHSEVTHIYAAKQEMVLITTMSSIRVKPRSSLSTS